jgi:ubiquinone/menaquinone biosynthesis C-methylase UbiE
VPAKACSSTASGDAEEAMRHFSLSAPLARTCLALVVTLNAAYGQEPQVRPDINRPFIHPEYQQWVSRFEHPGREVYDRRHDIVDATGVSEGMRVADIGAGTGLFTLLFAEKVGSSGKVYAVDISRVFINNILQRSREAGRHNVEGIVDSASDVGLPPQSIDIAFVCDTYHHFEKPLEMMQSIHRALKPGGRLILVDFRRLPGVSTPWIMDHVRAGQAEVVREIESTGFELVDGSDFLRTNYFLRFDRRGGH